MVPLSERRHRLYQSEIPEVILGLRLRLIQLLKEKNDPERAQLAFRCLHRLMGEKPGRPTYPEFSWEYLSYYVYEGEEHILKRLEEMKKESARTDSVSVNDHGVGNT
jgi:hypothetical protein